MVRLGKIFLSLVLLVSIFLTACGVKRGPTPAYTTPNPFQVDTNSSPSPSPTPNK